MPLVVNLKADTGLVDRSENTIRFYEDIRKFPVMTREDEILWFDRLRHGTKSEQTQARQYIVNCNQRLVVAVAKKWANTDNLTDYINEANIGLMEAIDAFDPSKGNKFCSFAMWYLKRAITQYHTNTMSMIYKTNISKTYHLMSKVTNAFVQKNEREPTAEELMLAINSRYKQGIKDKHDLTQIEMTRIDFGDSEDTVGANSDILEYNRASACTNSYEEKQQREFNSKVVNSLLRVLSPKETEIIKMQFGLYEEHGLKRAYEMNEIADRIGLTQERVRQLSKKAIKKMKAAYEDSLKRLV